MNAVGGYFFLKGRSILMNAVGGYFFKVRSMLMNAVGGYFFQMESDQYFLLAPTHGWSNLCKYTYIFLENSHTYASVKIIDK